jgi:sulfoxide reductase catalytic subunit YedY
MLIRIRKPWEIVPASEATPESVFMNRRELLRAAVASGLVLAAGPFALADDKDGPYPAKRNDKYKLDRNLTDEKTATETSNFWEFTKKKPAVKYVSKKFKPEPWKVEVSGLCNKPATFDIDDLRKFDHEERLYRHRCVEAWSMAVPWIGFPMAKLLEKVDPKAEAKYVRFESLARPEEMPGIKENSDYTFPYYEGLTIEEAKNELALFVTGIYGKKLPNVHGAPIRAVVPWKYGYKGPKIIVKIELVKEKPETFWHKAFPEEYGFFSNVNPEVPHPRWSQAEETMLGTKTKRETLLYNGYGELVADLYKDMKLTKPGD